MAKHDRVTVYVQNAPPVVLVARGAGASVTFKTERDGWTTVEELNNSRPPIAVREAKVQNSSIISIVRDRTLDDPQPPRTRVKRNVVADANA